MEFPTWHHVGAQKFWVSGASEIRVFILGVLNLHMTSRSSNNKEGTDSAGEGVTQLQRTPPPFHGAGMPEQSKVAPAFVRKSLLLCEEVSVHSQVQGHDGSLLGDAPSPTDRCPATQLQKERHLLEETPAAGLHHPTPSSHASQPLKMHFQFSMPGAFQMAPQQAHTVLILPLPAPLQKGRRRHQ